MPVPAIAAAAIPAAASLVTSAFNLYQNERMADRSERLSNTAHQREVQDLIKAGLNPILSARSGGASTPISAASMSENPATSALQAMNQKQNLDLVKAQTRNLNAQARTAEVDADIKEYSAPFAKQQPEMDLALKQNQVYRSDAESQPRVLRAIAQKIIDDAGSANAQAELLRNEIPASWNSSEADRTWFGKYIRPYIKDILGGTQSYKNVK